MGPILNSNRLVIDTNIIIDYLRGKEQAISFFKDLDPSTDLLISTITVAELYAGVKNQEEEQLLHAFLQDFKVIALDQTIAQKGGLIKNKYNPSHGIGIADAVIAATALVQKAKLLTLNVKHFPMVDLKEAPY